MTSEGRTALLTFVSTIAASVAAAVIASFMIDSMRERRANAPLPRPPVDGFDQT